MKTDVTREKLFKRIIIPILIILLTPVSIYWIVYYKVYLLFIGYIVALLFLLWAYKVQWKNMGDHGHSSMQEQRSVRKTRTIFGGVTFILIGFFVLFYMEDLFPRLVIGIFLAWLGIDLIRRYIKSA